MPIAFGAPFWAMNCGCSLPKLCANISGKSPLACQFETCGRLSFPSALCCTSPRALVSRTHANACDTSSATRTPSNTETHRAEVSASRSRSRSCPPKARGRPRRTRGRHAVRDARLRAAEIVSRWLRSPRSSALRRSSCSRSRFSKGEFGLRRTGCGRRRSSVTHPGSARRGLCPARRKDPDGWPGPTGDASSRRGGRVPSRRGRSRSCTPIRPSSIRSPLNRTTKPPGIWGYPSTRFRGAGSGRPCPTDLSSRWTTRVGGTAAGPALVMKRAIRNSGAPKVPRDPQNRETSARIPRIPET